MVSVLQNKPSLHGHLREEFPGPERDSGPQLPEKNRPAQVGFDLRQQLRSLPVQAVTVRQQAIINNLLLGNKPLHNPIHSHVPPWLGSRSVGSWRGP